MLDSVWTTGLLAEMALKGAAVLALAGVAALALRRASAAWRHGVWSFAVLAALAMPILVVGVPSLELTLPAQVQNRAAEWTGIELNTFVAENAVAANPVAAIETKAAQHQATPVRGYELALLSLVSLWAIGSVAVLFSLSVALLRLARIRRVARPVDARVYAMADRERFAARVRRPVTLIECDAAGAPMTWGVFRPIIALPAGHKAWPEETLRTVLRHELAHIKRKDFLTQLLASAACAVHWFNPLVWYAAHRMRVEREAACDDAVLASGVAATAYAEQLLHVASALHTRRWPTAAVAMAQTSALEGRVRHILSATCRRVAMSKRTVRVGVVTALAFAAVLAACNIKTEGAAEPPAARNYSNVGAIDGLVRAELLGICGHDNGSTTWWAPDGTPMDGPPAGFENFESGVSFGAEKARRDFAFRLTYSGAEDPATRWNFSASGSSATNGLSDSDNPDVLRILLAGNFEYNVPQTDIMLGIAAGPWESRSTVPDLDHAGLAEAAGPILGYEWDILWGPPDVNGEFTVSTNHAGAAIQDRVVATLESGETRALLNTGTMSGKIVRASRFEFPADVNVTGYEYQTRPFANQLSFINVPLNPGTPEKPMWTRTRDLSFGARLAGNRKRAED